MAAVSSPCRLFIGNLPWDTEDAALQALFAGCGTVVKCEIPKGRQGRSRGYGIVEFSSPHEAQLAVQTLHGAAGRQAGFFRLAAVLTRAAAALLARAGHHIGDRDITVREDKAVPPKSAPVKAAKAAGAAAAPPAAEGCRVYVGNLAWETTEEELQGALAALAARPAAPARRRGRPANATTLRRRRRLAARRLPLAARR
jgi:RNA recognition motif-containing protein